MQPPSSQLSLVLIGTMIGVAGSLVVVLLTAYFSGRRFRLEQRQKLKELLGKRQAILDRRDAVLQVERVSAKGKVNDFKAWERISSRYVGVLVGYVDETNKQLSQLADKAEDLVKEREDLQSRVDAHERELRTLEAEKVCLERQLSHGAGQQTDLPPPHA